MFIAGVGTVNGALRLILECGRGAFASILRTRKGMHFSGHLRFAVNIGRSKKGIETSSVYGIHFARWYSDLWASGNIAPLSRANLSGMVCHIFTSYRLLNHLSD